MFTPIEPEEPMNLTAITKQFQDLSLSVDKYNAQDLFVDGFAKENSLAKLKKLDDKIQNLRRFVFQTQELSSLSRVKLFSNFKAFDEFKNKAFLSEKDTQNHFQLFRQSVHAVLKELQANMSDLDAFRGVIKQNFAHPDLVAYRNFMALSQAISSNEVDVNTALFAAEVGLHTTVPNSLEDSDPSQIDKERVSLANSTNYEQIKQGAMEILAALVGMDHARKTVSAESCVVSTIEKNEIETLLNQILGD